LRTAWETLKSAADAQDRDEILSKFDGQSLISKGLRERVSNATSQVNNQLNKLAGSSTANNRATNSRDAER